MAHYGRDYTAGRFTRRNPGDTGGYDSDFGGNWYGGGWAGNRGHGWNEYGNQGWTGRGRSSGMGNYEDTWGTPGYGTNRGYQGPQDWGTNRWQSGWGGGMNRGRMGNYGNFGNYGGMGRSFYDQDVYRGRHIGHDYDEDLGDRVRRGWNRFRENARGWMGRGGYGGGW